VLNTALHRLSQEGGGQHLVREPRDVRRVSAQMLSLERAVTLHPVSWGRGLFLYLFFYFFLVVRVHGQPFFIKTQHTTQNTKNVNQLK